MTSSLPVMKRGTAASTTRELAGCSKSATELLRPFHYAGTHFRSIADYAPVLSGCAIIEWPLTSPPGH